MRSNNAGYVNDFEFVDNHRAGKIVVELNGRINKCGCISPRYDISHRDFERWIEGVLPSRQFGIIVITTSSGIMSLEQARRRQVGGKVRFSVVPMPHFLLSLMCRCTTFPADPRVRVLVGAALSIDTCRYLRPFAHAGKAQNGSVTGRTRVQKAICQVTNELFRRQDDSGEGR